MEHFLSRNLVGRTRRLLNNDLRPGQVWVSSRMAKTFRERNAHQRRLKPHELHLLTDLLERVHCEFVGAGRT
jgi:hypothetical protein